MLDFVGNILLIFILIGLAITLFAAGLLLLKMAIEE